jgi:glucokinase
MPHRDSTDAGLGLVADIGATHARFALADEQGLRGTPVVLATRGFTDARLMLIEALRRLGDAAPAAVCLAIAGPVGPGGGRITNGGLAFEPGVLARQVNGPVFLVNDFVAVARSLPDLEQLRPLGGGSMQTDAVKAAIGPGSGLGMGLLIPARGGWQVLPSEGGHADLPAGNPLEAEIVGWLQRQHGHASWETVLSGPGLVRLYQAVCAVWGTTAEAVSPEWITAQGRDADDPVCHQTLEIFFGLLGAAAGNLALTACAWGGVYLGGGILPGLAEELAASALRRRFDERGPHAERVRNVPLLLILDPAPGLVGARSCLWERLRQSR